ncbi:MAG: lipid A export permease/ATP-binding protein MsbA [Thioalkalispiraceae bacterium]|jgi:subfamily B ATP-binding cassette protein MsbA
MSQHSAHSGGLGVYRRLLSFAVPHWKIFILAIIGMVVFSATDAAFARLIEPMLDGSFVDKDPDTIKWVPLMIILVFLVRVISGFMSNYGMAWIARNVIHALRSRMFNQLLQLPSRFYDHASSGVLLSKLLYDVEQLAQASSTVITIVIRDTLTIAWLVALMLYHSVSLTLIFLVVTPFMALLVAFISKRFRKLSKRIQHSMGDVSHVAQESIDANREIKIFGGQQYETRQFQTVNDYNRKQQLKLSATNAISVPFVQFIVAVAFAAIVYLATQPEILEVVTVGKFMSFLIAMLLMMQPIRRLTMVNENLQRGIAAAESVFDFLDQEIERDTGTRKLEKVKGHVQFKNASFSYEQNKPDILQDIELDIAPGQSVAFVGRSGAGKTTLVSLLPRFYDLSAGQILIDGNDIHDVQLASLRENIALVSQHVTLFNDTIAHNIAYGVLEDASEQDLRTAARAAHALEFIESLPEGFNTMVGENGVLLSGGQRQRLAIARAILKNAPILILDEATSALDTESERHIQGALNELMKNRTTLVIAHRLSTIESVDRIVVLEQGRIVETGTHNQLLEKQGKYAALYNMQFAEA